MAYGQRPSPRRRGRDGDPPESPGGRILVLPGEEIPTHGLTPGPGTYRVGGRVFASVLGLLEERPPVVRIVPLSGRYIPKPRDVVVGIVADVQPTFWLLDIGAPRWAPLHSSGAPWSIEYGETAQHLTVGDCVVVAVETIENTGRIGVTMNGEGLGKLESGTIVTVSAARVPRVIGRGGSMIGMIQRYTGTMIVVGQNGRIWIDGPPEGVLRTRECLNIIDNEGQFSGLTDRIQSHLSSLVSDEELARLEERRRQDPLTPFGSMPQGSQPPRPPREERRGRSDRGERGRGPPRGRAHRGEHDRRSRGQRPEPSEGN